MTVIRSSYRGAISVVSLLAIAVCAHGAVAQEPTKKAVQPKVTGPAPVPLARHRVAIQVNQNDKAVMDLALSNVRNITEYYKEKGETVAIEVVTYGPGLHMLRSDTSPVKDRIAPMALENSSVTFIACGNTQANQSKAEGKPVTLISEAKVMPSGVVRLIELQRRGYAYIRP
jgi:intracellular sulfur oxidation DsrE/DsrF family protein